MKVKTAKLTGAALDWAVAKCEGVAFSALPSSKHYFAPSRNWNQAGPIIEREQLDLTSDNSRHVTELWQADNALDCAEYGSTPLIAAMRCYVASKLGDEIDVPEELLK